MLEAAEASGTGRQRSIDASRNSLKAGFKRGNCPNEGHDIAAALFSRRAGNVGETGQTFSKRSPASFVTLRSAGMKTISEMPASTAFSTIQSAFSGATRL